MDVNPPVVASRPLVAEGADQLRDLWEAEDPEWAWTAAGRSTVTQTDPDYALSVLARVYVLAFSRTLNRGSIYHMQSVEEVITWFARCLRFQLCHGVTRQQYTAERAAEVFLPEKLHIEARAMAKGLLGKGENFHFQLKVGTDVLREGVSDYFASMSFELAGDRPRNPGEDASQCPQPGDQDQQHPPIAMGSPTSSHYRDPSFDPTVFNHSLGPGSGHSQRQHPIEEGDTTAYGDKPAHWVAPSAHGSGGLPSRPSSETMSATIMAAFPKDFQDMVSIEDERMAELDRGGFAPQHPWRKLVRDATQARLIELASRLHQHNSLSNKLPTSHACAGTSSQPPDGLPREYPSASHGLSNLGELPGPPVPSVNPSYGVVPDYSALMPSDRLTNVASTIQSLSHGPSSPCSSTTVPLSNHQSGSSHQQITLPPDSEWFYDEETRFYRLKPNVRPT